MKSWELKGEDRWQSYVPERQRINITLHSSKVFLCRMKFQTH